MAEEITARKAVKVRVFGDDLRLYECPVSYITFETAEIMKLVYLMEDSKVLLHPGGWGDQPAWLVEAVGIFRAEEARRMKKEQSCRLSE